MKSSLMEKKLRRDSMIIKQSHRRRKLVFLIAFSSFFLIADRFYNEKRGNETNDYKFDSLIVTYAGGQFKASGMF